MCAHALDKLHLAVQSVQSCIAPSLHTKTLAFEHANLTAAVSWLLQAQGQLQGRHGE